MAGTAKVRRSHRRLVRPFFTREMLANQRVVVPRTGEESLSIDIQIAHGLTDNMRFPLGFDMACEFTPLVHIFNVLPYDNPDEPVSEDVRRAVAALPQPQVSEHQRRNEGEIAGLDAPLLLARLRVHEYPAAWLEAGGWSWYDAMDCSELQGAGLIAEVVTGVEERRDQLDLTALLDGSLFVYEMLEVNPAMRGQCLGARLMAHALASLPRTYTDISVAVVYPERCIWDAPEEPRSADEAEDRSPPDNGVDNVRRLLGYYQRLGWKEWRREHARRQPGEETAIWIRHDKVLPFMRRSRADHGAAVS